MATRLDTVRMVRNERSVSYGLRETLPLMLRPAPVWRRDPGETSTRSAALDVAVLAALPFVLTLAVPDWYFASPNGIDPWLYHGFFRHLDLYNSTLFPGTY